jgi:phosphohistidine phosphatase
MKLYFLRHGLAGDRGEWQGDDAKRPLTTEGKDKMKRAAVMIRKLGIKPDLIITSPLVRALQTAEVVAKELDLKDALLTDARLSPGFDVLKLIDVIRAHPKANAIIFVGHEPDFSATVGKLIGGGTIEFKKGALALVELPDPAKLKGTLAWLLPPRILAL